MVKQKEWQFVLNLFTIIVSFKSLYLSGGSAEYVKEVYSGLEKKLGHSLGYCKEFAEADWHSIIQCPSIVTALCSGLILTPHFYIGNSYGWADNVCVLIGLVLFFFLSKNALVLHPNEKEMITREINRLYWKILK